MSRALFNETKAPRGASQMGLAFAMFALAIGLLGWRAMAVFTAPAPMAQPSEFTALAETITGPNRTRIMQGENGTLMILIDGPEGALASADATRLTALAATLYPSAPPAIIRQYPFAVGTLTRPTNAELGELAGLGLLALLAGWLALTLPHKVSISAPMQADPIQNQNLQVPTQVKTPRPTPIAHAPNRAYSPVEKAATLAQKDPEATAAIIREWLRQEEGHA